MCSVGAIPGISVTNALLLGASNRATKEIFPATLVKEP